MTNSRLDSDLFQGTRVGEQEPLLGSGRGQNLEAEGLACCPVDQLPILQPVARFFEQGQCLAAPIAILSAAVAVRQSERAVHDRQLDRVRVRREQFPLGCVRLVPVGAQVGAVEIALGTVVLAVIERAVDPGEIEQLDQRFAHASVGEDCPPRVEHERRHAGRRLHGQSLFDDAAVAQGRKIVAFCPARRVMLGAKLNEPRLEGFE